MVKFCNYCGLEIHIPDTFTCAYCNSPFCIEHRLIEDHDCQPARKLKLEQKFSKQVSSEIRLDWMYECLSIAQDIINMHHKDESDFFSKSKFTLFIQKNGNMLMVTWLEVESTIELESIPHYQN